MLKNKGPKIDPCGTPDFMLDQELYESCLPSFFVFYLKGNYSCMRVMIGQNHKPLI